MSAPLHAGILPPRPEAYPPAADPSRADTLLGADTPPPPSSMHAGRCGQQAGGTHPTGMQSCFILK